MQRNIKLTHLKIRSCREKILSTMVTKNKEVEFSDIREGAVPYSKSVILGELVKLNELCIIEYSGGKPRKYKIRESAKEDVGIKKILEQIKYSIEPDATIFKIGKSNVTYPDNPDLDFSLDVALVSNKLDNADLDIFKIPLDEVFEGETLNESITELTRLHAKLYDKIKLLDCHQELKDLQKEIYEQEKKVSRKSEFMGFRNVLADYMLKRSLIIIEEEQKTKKPLNNDLGALVSNIKEIMKESFKIIITVN